MADRATPNLPSTGFDQTITFYQRLGFSVDYRDEHWLILTRGGLMLEFYRHALDPHDNNSSCCFRADDIDALFHAFSLANIPINSRSIPRLMPVTGRGEAKSFDLVDADGNLIRCMQAQRSDGERSGSEAAIRLLGTGDEHVFDQVVHDLFDHPVDLARAAEFLNDPRHHIAVAVAEEVVVGFASAVHYVHPDQEPQLFINEVAVDESYRRRGFGKAILNLLLGVGRRLGCSEAWVLTDRDNQAAMALYRSVGADQQPPDSVMFSYFYGRQMEAAPACQLALDGDRR